MVYTIAFLLIQFDFHNYEHRSCRNSANWNGYHDHSSELRGTSTKFCCLHHARRLATVSERRVTSSIELYVILLLYLTLIFQLQRTISNGR